MNTHAEECVFGFILLIIVTGIVGFGVMIGAAIYDPSHNGYECTDERIVDHKVECYKWEKKNEQR